MPRREHIVLIGLSGSGKSTVAPLLARALGMQPLDLDREIERAARLSVAELFSRHGEAHFRELEARLLLDALSGPPVVIAAGGGAVVSPANRALMFSRATTVWLRTEPVRLAARLAADPSEARPLAAGDARARLEAMLSERERFYALADVTLDTDTTSPQETAQRILEALRTLQA